MLKAISSQLHKSYIDISMRAADEMSSNVTVKNLRYSILCLPSYMKKEHKGFVNAAKADVNKAESIDDIFVVVGEHNDYLSYSLLKYLIDMYGSDELKQEMADYVKKIDAFRKTTRLELFSEVCADKLKKVNANLSKMITKHEMDWATATLEDVENLRMDICRELSLHDFSLNLVTIARGCVEITWQVPSPLVAYIQKSVKPNSLTMMKHHVTTLTIDGFIVYDGTTGISLSLASCFHA